MCEQQLAAAREGGCVGLRRRQMSSAGQAIAISNVDALAIYYRHI